MVFIAGILKKKKICEPLTRPMGLNVMAYDRHGFRGHHRRPVPVLRTYVRWLSRRGGCSNADRVRRQNHGRSKSREMSKLRATRSPSAVTAPPSTADELDIGRRELFFFPTAKRSAPSALSFPFFSRKTSCEHEVPYV